MTRSSALPRLFVSGNIMTTDTNTLAQHLLQRLQKSAAMDASQVQQESGGAPAEPAAAAQMPAIDPATGAPMGAPPAPPPPPPTLEQLLATGDPVVGLLVEMKKSLDAILGAFGELMDSAGMQVPASKLLTPDSDSKPKSPAPAAAAPAPPKTAVAPGLVDDSDPDVDIPAAPNFRFSSAPPTLTLGQPKLPGSGLAKTLDTKLASGNQRNQIIADSWSSNRLR